MKDCFLFVVFLFSVKCFSAQVDQHYFDQSKLLKNLKVFSADSMEGRGTGEPGGLKAQRFIQEQFSGALLLSFEKDYSHSFNYANPFRKKKIEGTNVIGWIKGFAEPEKYIIVSSHHDHLGIRNGEVYNGADDNASGTCALFSIVEYLTAHPPRCSFVFIAFDAEENGLIGSKHFVRKPPIPLEQVVFNLNLDMISRSEKNEIFICGTHHYPEFKPVLNAQDSLSVIDVVFGHDSVSSAQEDWTYSSDHGSFHRKNIPFIYLGVENHIDYHKPTDDFDQIDPEFYVEAVCISIRIAKELDAYFSP